MSTTGENRNKYMVVFISKLANIYMYMNILIKGENDCLLSFSTEINLCCDENEMCLISFNKEYKYFTFHFQLS